MPIERRTPGRSPLFPGSVVAGGVVYTSGLVGPRALAAAPDAPLIPIAEQIDEALAELASVLEASGSNVESVVRIDSYITTIDDFAAWNEAFAKTWPSESPARAPLIAAFPRPQAHSALTAVGVLAT